MTSDPASASVGSTDHPVITTAGLLSQSNKGDLVFEAFTRSVRSRRGIVLRIAGAAAMLSLLWPQSVRQPGIVAGAGPTLPNPILFVTQVPPESSFVSITEVFGNHQGTQSLAPRGGDLWIRYPDGTLRNLTDVAKLGQTGLQASKAIAVRDPSVHWDGTKALFSMVEGNPTKQYEIIAPTYWQMYEVTGLGPNDPVKITKVLNQPEQFNNITPFYGTDDRILFTSDRPRNGERHLYPQLDEYELAPTVSGIWSLDPATGDLFMLNQSPSGVFSPNIDSAGRVIFTRWDHLQRDQQADADSKNPGAYGTYGTFNYTDESASAAKSYDRTEVFPEPRVKSPDLAPNANTQSFNLFQPWQIHEDGSEEETLNHFGRQEFGAYIPRSFNDDPKLQDSGSSSLSINQNEFSNFIQVREDPTQPGRFVGVDAPEFATRASGQIISVYAPLLRNADQISVTYLTHRSTASYPEDGQPAPAGHSGHYRDPLVLSDGRLIAAHTAEVRRDRREGTSANPTFRYDFRLKTVVKNGADWVADQPLTAGLSKNLTWWSPDNFVTYTGPLWELSPVEVVARPRPAKLSPKLSDSVKQVFADQGVTPEQLQAYLRANSLALAVSNDVTTRDYNDFQQPFNLRVAGSGHQTVRPGGGKIYDVKFLQLFQADQLRGWGGTDNPRAGRRVLARPMHALSNQNPPLTGAPQGSVQVAADGSVAAFVPARRAMTWQLTDPSGTPVVRERYWVTFQSGEIRVCASCHGVNTTDQAGQQPPENKPLALASLLQYWKDLLNGNLPPVPTPTPGTSNPSRVTVPGARR